jgi:hypothetical protein
MAGRREDTLSVDAPAIVARLTTRRQPVGRPGAPRGPADKPNLHRAAIGAILVGTLVLLLSMGGAILAAPVLLPLLWWAARTTTRRVRLTGVILAALGGRRGRLGRCLPGGCRAATLHLGASGATAAVTVWLLLITTSIDPRGPGSRAHPAA